MHKDLLRDSEGHRHELQVHITTTSVKLRQDTDEHRLYQEELIAENEALRREIQALKQHQARREQDFLHSQEDASVAHKAKVDALIKEHTDRFTALSNDSQARIDRLQRDNHDKLTQVT